MAIPGSKVDVNIRPRRLADDQATVNSLDYADEYTLPGDDFDDAFSDFSVSTRDSFDSYTCEQQLPSYRVPREQGVSQPVYESWILRYSGDTKDVSHGTRICGVDVVQNWDKNQGFVDVGAQPYEQADLQSMHADAINRYQAAHKRCLPSRLVRGRAPLYERDLDARVRKLPDAVQKELNMLLGDREVASGNKQRQRDWTVVAMREQLHYRFSSAEFEEVKRHKLRFWKNPSRDQPVEYFFVLRGADGMLPKDAAKGVKTPRRHGNPWKNVDRRDRVADERMRRLKRYGDKDGLELPRVTVHRRAVTPLPRYRYNAPPDSVPPSPPPALFDYRPAPPRPYVSVGPPPPAPGPHFPLRTAPPLIYPTMPAYPGPRPRCGFAPMPPPPIHPPLGPVGVGPCNPPFAPLPQSSLWHTAVVAGHAPGFGGPTNVSYPPGAIPGLSPPRFPAPPPAPMPSNLTTPSFTASGRTTAKGSDADKDSVGGLPALGNDDNDSNNSNDSNAALGNGADSANASSARFAAGKPKVKVEDCGWDW